MAMQIQLKDKVHNAAVSLPVAQLAWDRLIASGVTAFSAGIVNADDVTDTHKTFYYLDNAALSGGVLTDVIDSDSSDNLFYIGSRALYLDNFVQQGSPTPWADFATLRTWTAPVQNAAVLEMHGSFVPNKLYYSSDTAAVDYETQNGGAVGGAIGIVKSGSDVAAVACVGSQQTGYLGGVYQQTNAGLVPRWQGYGCVDFATHPTRNFATASVSYNIGTTSDTDLPTPSLFVTQCVYTQIDGYPYVAMCAILLDDAGTPSEISGVFLPAWFWGGIKGQPDIPELPDIYDIPPTVPDIGIGTYSITESPAGIAVPPSVSPIASVDTSHGGIHVFVCDAAAIAEIEDQLWSQAWANSERGISSAMSGIIACGFMPEELIGVNYKDPSYKRTTVELGGYPIQLSGGNAYLINHRIFTKTYISSPESHFATFTDELDEVYHSYHDYEPYTSVKLTLPFCGELSIPASACIGGKITVDYSANLTTGDVCATVRATSSPHARNGLKTQGALTTTYYCTGNAFSRFPITGSSNGMSQYMAGAAQAVSGIASILAGGVTGAVAGGAQLVGGVTAALNADKQPVSGAAPIGSPSIIGNKQVILEVTRPSPWADAYYKQQIPPAAEMYVEHIGSAKLPAGDSATVDGVHTPVVVKEVYFKDTDGLSSAELGEIERLLKGGILL